DRVEGRQVVVADRPVDPDAIQAPHAKVRGRETPEIAGIPDRAATDGVVDEDADRIVTEAGHRIIGRPLPDVGTRRPGTSGPHLPIEMVLGTQFWRNPISLFQADYVDLAPGETPGHRTPG